MGGDHRFVVASERAVVDLYKRAQQEEDESVRAGKVVEVKIDWKSSSAHAVVGRWLSATIGKATLTTGNLHNLIIRVIIRVSMHHWKGVVGD